MNDDLLIYVAHALLWIAFGITRFVVQRSSDAVAVPDPQEAARATTTAPHSRMLLVVHSLAFGFMYFGLGVAVIRNQVPNVWAGQRVAGALVIAPRPR